MASIDEKRALVAKLTDEIKELEERDVVKKLLDTIAKGPTTTYGLPEDRVTRFIVCNSVTERYRHSKIPDHILRIVANELGYDIIYQRWYHSGDDYGCGDYIWLELGMPVKDKIAQVEAELAALKKRTK
jgi:hypothetical protein